MPALMPPNDARTSVNQGRTIWIVDAQCGDGRRFIVRSDEKLTAFVELESAIHGALNSNRGDSSPMSGEALYTKV
jgi:hypothetical protein